jgi:receptor-type tyrosine-protein phosphatase gamma
MISLLNPDEEPLEVRHYHETCWEDDKGMDQYTDIDKMTAKITKFRTNYPDSPVVVHCSAGLGRTGTLICIYSILEAVDKLDFDQKLRSERPDMEVPSFDKIENDYDNMNLLTPRISVFGAVRKMREQRWSLVKKQAQYNLIYEYLEQFVKKKHFDKVLSINSDEGQEVGLEELGKINAQIAKVQMDKEEEEAAQK